MSSSKSQSSKFPAVAKGFCLKFAFRGCYETAANVLSMRISLDWTKYAKRADLIQFFHQVLGRVSGLPGVESAAVSVMVPLNGNVGTTTGGVLVEGRPVDPG